MMPRLRFRLLVAAATLCALLVTGVSPALARVMAWTQTESHACCPETIRESATEGHRAGAPMPCCAIGNSRQPAPVKGPTASFSVVAGVSVGPVFWSQPVRPASILPASSPIALGQIPPLLRTSVLLI